MKKKAAVFLDLQGTLGGEANDDIRNFTFFECTVPAIRLINNAGLPAVIITNQSHIAKGYFSYQYFREKIAALQEEMKRAGARIDVVYC